MWGNLTLLDLTSLLLCRLRFKLHFKMIARVRGYFRHTLVETAMCGHGDSSPQYSVVQGVLKINLNHPILLNSIPPHYMTDKINCQNLHQHMPANDVSQLYTAQKPQIICLKRTYMQQHHVFRHQGY